MTGDLDDLQPLPVRGVHPDQVSTQTQLSRPLRSGATTKEVISISMNSPSMWRVT